MSPGPSVTLEMISDWTRRRGGVRGRGFVETIRTTKWRKKKKGQEESSFPADAHRK